MSLAEDLKLIDVFNQHNLTSEGNPLIYYVSDTGRGGAGRHWVLCVKGKGFKEATFWRQNGNLWFSDFQYSKKEGLQKAIEKVKELFPEIEMVKGPWRDTWVCKKDLDDCKEQVKAKKAEENANA
jgi:hypothetical protein